MPSKIEQQEVGPPAACRSNENCELSPRLLDRNGLALKVVDVALIRNTTLYMSVVPFAKRRMWGVKVGSLRSANASTYRSGQD